MPPLERALTGLLGAQRVFCSRDALLAWECDGFTVHRSRPRAVVLPESTGEVQAVVRLLHMANVPFVPRGAGTCLSGGPTASGDAVVIDLARMRKVLQISTEDLYAVVQPGVVNLDLTAAVRHLGLHYAPDPSSQSVCTIGGNLAENSGGPHCFKYGMTQDHVLGATIVLPDGTLARLGDAAGPRAPHGLDLTALFCGSEGTFAIATEITVRLCRDQESVRTLLAAFASMTAACRTVSDIVAAGLVPAALEILDQATIRAVEASVYRAGYPADAAAVLLVELDGPAVVIAEETAEVREFFRRNGALSIEEASDAAERKRLWKGRKGAFGAMGRLNTDLYVLDGVVPRTRLEEALDGITAIGQKHGVVLTNVFHAGDGNLHPNISFDGRDAQQTARTVAAGREILQLCVDLGGSISGEHGIGSEKLDHVGMMFDAADLDVMARVRAVFNPDGLCNPGKVLPQRGACAEVAKWPQMVARVLDTGERP
ncbi:MAG TPA: FAD-linked oxidase C-terminal domain-containing protein [Planctomycetota bacterium]|nr:FAD-linked oxidase C-terminal domain-containing protein [Planctomycetota bacterium]